MLKSVDGYDDELITVQDSIQYALDKEWLATWRSDIIVYTSPRDRLFTMVKIWT